MSNANVYQIVTDRIIAELEKGIIPWQKPWAGVQSGAYNRVTQKPYSILNQMLLGHSGEYASFKQWSNLGGHIRKGAESEIIVFWSIKKYEKTNEDGETETTSIPFLKYHRVFHISQVEGVKSLEKPTIIVEPIEKAERLINDYVTREGLTFVEKAGDKAYYSPLRDLVVVPLKEQFREIREYYSVAFHELTHSTGHSSRLKRIEGNVSATFGSEKYSKEELVAEIGSANILNRLGIETEGTFKNSAAYIQNWLKVLKDDNKFIVSAASKAEKAVNYIMDTREVR